MVKHKHHNIHHKEEREEKKEEEEKEEEVLDFNCKSTCGIHYHLKNQANKVKNFFKNIISKVKLLLFI